MSPSTSSQTSQESISLKQADERRKQLNRRAQKAFRERRSEHMAQLEITLGRMQKELHESQEAQSKAKEELLMVKYKNSLLERLLLEHGIDVHKELTRPRPTKQHRENNAHPRHSHKRRRTSDSQSPTIVSYPSEDTEQVQLLQSSRIPINAPQTTTTINLAGMSREDMINLLSAFSHPAPPGPAATPLHQVSPRTQAPSPQESLDPCDFPPPTILDHSPPRMPAPPAPITIHDGTEDELQSPTTASPDSTRTPPPVIQPAYEDFATAAKVNKFAFGADAGFPGDDLLSFDGLGVDPFGLDDIMNFPCQF